MQCLGWPFDFCRSSVAWRCLAAKPACCSLRANPGISSRSCATSAQCSSAGTPASIIPAAQQHPCRPHAPGPWQLPRLCIHQRHGPCNIAAASHAGGPCPGAASRCWQSHHQSTWPAIAAAAAAATLSSKQAFVNCIGCTNMILKQSYRIERRISSPLQALYTLQIFYQE